MTVSWTRATLETHVTVLSARHQGRDFVDAIAELADTLDGEEVVMLREILLQRAHDEGAYHAKRFDPLIEERRRRRWWQFPRRPHR
jgi:hypothetical protein